MAVEVLGIANARDLCWYIFFDISLKASFVYGIELAVSSSCLTCMTRRRVVSPVWRHAWRYCIVNRLAIIIIIIKSNTLLLSTQSNFPRTKTLQFWRKLSADGLNIFSLFWRVYQPDHPHPLSIALFLSELELQDRTWIALDHYSNTC